MEAHSKQSTIMISTYWQPFGSLRGTYLKGYTTLYIQNTSGRGKRVWHEEVRTNPTQHRDMPANKRLNSGQWPLQGVVDAHQRIAITIT